MAAFSGSRDQPDRLLSNRVDTCVDAGIFAAGDADFRAADIDGRVESAPFVDANFRAADIAGRVESVSLVDANLRAADIADDTNVTGIATSAA